MTTKGYSLIGVGGVVVVLGIIWTALVFPSFEKIPDDFVRVDEFTGSYTVVDPIVKQVQDSTAIERLRTDPSAVKVLSDPATVAFLTGPEVANLLANETLRGLIANPAQLRQALSNPQALAQAVGPDVARTLANPTIAPILTNQAIMGLMNDPEAMKLALDPRVMALMADPTALPTITVPVKVYRERRAIETEGGTMNMREEVATTMIDPTSGKDTGVEVPGFGKTGITLSVDSKTRQYLPGTEGDRTGSLSFPFNVDHDKTYSLYVSAARQPLSARYVNTESRDGLQVMVFQINESESPMGTHPELGLPLVADSEITLWVEPRSGRVVDVDEKATTVSVRHPAGGKQTVFESSLKLTDQTVTDQIAVATDDRSTLSLFGTYVPWGLAVAGLAVAVVGAIVGRGRGRQAKGAVVQPSTL